MPLVNHDVMFFKKFKQWEMTIVSFRFQNHLGLGFCKIFENKFNIYVVWIFNVCYRHYERLIPIVSFEVLHNVVMSHKEMLQCMFVVCLCVLVVLQMLIFLESC
jgi:hypothetical protein